MKKRKIKNNEKGYFFSQMALILFLVSMIFLFVGSNQSLQLANNLKNSKQYLNEIVEQRNTQNIMSSTLNNGR